MAALVASTAMKINRLVLVALPLLAAAAYAAAPEKIPADLPAPILLAQSKPPAGLPAEDWTRLKKDLDRFEERRKPETKHDAFADAGLFLHACVWAARYEPQLTPADAALFRKGLDRAEARMAADQSWTRKKGKVVRGYVSAVDGSVQPYGLIIPEGYDPAKPMRLDVIPHGSTRPVGMAELRFINGWDGGDEGGSAPKNDYIELYPLGRVENCSRWAGETDVFEAIEAACRGYNIDRKRIVLRGMSAGASSTWHLGLKHPDKFVALGPYCGYVDTHQFSLTPLGNFVKVGQLPDYQEKTLHMLDSQDYAANAGVVPCVAAIGDKDPFFQAHVIMGEAFRREGLQMVNLISPGTGHVIDPVTHAEQMRRIKVFADRGIDATPKHIRFVTWTLKYSKCHWIEVLGLGEHYQRAEIEATLDGSGGVDVKEPRNITRFALSPPSLKRLQIGSQEVSLPADAPLPLLVERSGGAWRVARSHDLSGKLPGLQGPIDDAFTAPFLCVRGSGTPWNPTVGAWAEANLRRFRYDWARYFRGDLPLKSDLQVSSDDLRRYNIVLFGDPGSNSLLRRALPKLPVSWSRTQLRFAGGTYPASDHAPAFITENPLPEGRGHYLVVNSGHTFHEAELNTLNYLLFPRLGDWAVLKVGGKLPENPSEALDEQVLKAGFFDEQWKAPREKKL